MKKFSLRGLYLFAASMLFLLLHFPFAFSNSGGARIFSNDSLFSVKAEEAVTLPAAPASMKLYDSLHLDDMGLSQEAFSYGIKGYEKLKAAGKLMNQRVLSIVDFTQPSYKKRLFVIDLSDFKVLFNTYVAHGQNTGKEFARSFSNNPDSHQSSLGFYITSGTYIGSNGYSMYLNGLEKGFNNLAYERAIVMHGADYVNENFIRSQGYIGRSYGCPAVPEKLNKPIIEKIKNGSCLFIYSNNKNYLTRSRLINS
ncbi:MAG: murein L,D-transpeptidase catalytic domain family protein [Ferruginibacter sp.]